MPESVGEVFDDVEGSRRRHKTQIELIKKYGLLVVTEILMVFGRAVPPRRRHAKFNPDVEETTPDSSDLEDEHLLDDVAEAGAGYQTCVKRAAKPKPKRRSAVRGRCDIKACVGEKDCCPGLNRVCEDHFHLLSGARNHSTKVKKLAKTTGIPTPILPKPGAQMRKFLNMRAEDTVDQTIEQLIEEWRTLPEPERQDEEASSSSAGR